MASPKTRIEFRIKVSNEPGQLARVLGSVAQVGCNLTAFCGYATNTEFGLILMVPDHEGRTRRALQAANIESEEGPVLAIPVQPGKGSGAKTVQKLSDRGINIEYAYASSAPDGKSTVIVRVPEEQIETALKAVS